MPDQQSSFVGTLSLSLPIKDTAFLSGNEATEGYCDIATVYVSQGEINRNFMREDFIEAPETQYEQGERLRYVNEADLDSVTAVQRDIYFSPALWGIMITEQINSTMEICETLETLSSISRERDGFTSQGKCVACISALPINVDANSTGYRSIHANLARERPDTHCPHISYFPEEDMHGKIKCSESSNFSSCLVYKRGKFVWM